MDFEVRRSGDIQYVIKFPKNYKSNEKHPVIISLHGAGGRGTDVTERYNNNLFNAANNISDFPFVCIEPQCHGNTWFDIYEQLKNFVVEIVSSDYADTERIYLMGASMGGYTVWQLAMSMPEFFAAIVPLCGGGMYWNGARLTNVPVWAFHGAKDKIVLPEESEKMVNSVLKHGGEAKLTIFPENEHNVWDDVYSDPEVYKWMLAHKNKNEKAINDIFTRSDLYG